MLAEMQDKLSQAVTMYGQILDGQQHYAQRQLQEKYERQRQQLYQYRPISAPSQSYDRYAPPLPNGHASPYAPPQQYQPAQEDRSAGPSMYPAMPSVVPNFVPQQYAPPLANSAPRTASPHLPYRVDSVPLAAQPYSSAQQSQQMPPQAYQHLPQTYSTPAGPSSPGVERHSSLRTAPVAVAPPGPQRQSSMTYGAAPPAIDQPPVSPAISKSSLPSGVSAAYTSPQSSHAHLAASPYQGPSWAPAQPNQPPQQYYQPPAQQPQYAAPNQVPSHVYSPASFPPAPAAVFPDAPSTDFVLNGLEGQEKQTQGEALLIEL